MVIKEQNVFRDNAAKVIGAILVSSVLSVNGCSSSNSGMDYTCTNSQKTTAPTHRYNLNIKYLRNISEVFRDYKSKEVSVELIPVMERTSAFEGLNVSLNNGRQYAWGIYSAGNEFAVTLVKSSIGGIHYEYNLTSAPKILPNDIVNISASISNGFLKLLINDKTANVQNELLIRSSATEIISNNKMGAFTGLSFIMNSFNPEFLYPTNSVRFNLISNVDAVDVSDSEYKISVDHSDKTAVKLNSISGNSVKNLALIDEEQNVKCDKLEIDFSNREFNIKLRR